jgi:hypothetical protein
MTWLIVVAIIVGGVFLAILIKNLERHTEGITLYNQGMNILTKHAHELTADQLEFTATSVAKLRQYKRFAVIDMIAIVISLTALLWNVYSLVKRLS